MKIAVPDLISNSYFPGPAAVELGFFRDEGLDVDLELIFPVDKAYEAMRDGEVDFLAGSSHSALAAFPNWQGAKLLAALSQGMYWLLIVKADLKAAQGDLAALKGLRIGAAPWVEMGLRQLLIDAGVDIEKEGIEIAPVPGAVKPGVSFGVTAAQALGDGKIDAFWANGMGAEVAVHGGVGTVLLDVRRGDGPAAAFNYTQPVLATTDRLIKEQPEAAEAAVRAIVRTQQALKADVSRATGVGEALFSPAEADLIADVVERDLPYYDPQISKVFVRGMNEFCRKRGLLEGDPPFEEIVAAKFMDLWEV